MKLFSKSLSLACALGMLGAFVTIASAQDEKCRDKVYNTSRKVLDGEQKANRKDCIDGGAGEACVLMESAKGESQETKLESLFQTGGKCETNPAFGVVTANGGTDIGDAAQAAADNITRAIFGDPVSGVVAGDKCHGKTIQRAGQKAVAEWKAFRKCAKTAASQGAVDTCVGTGVGDAKAGSKQAKLAADIADRCTTIPDAGMADGTCGAEANAADLAACIGDVVDCEVCTAINTMTGGTANCDQLDNAALDASCAAPIGEHKCTLDSGSQVELFSTLLNQTLAATGAVDITCGAADPGTGKAACSCGVQDPGFGPLNIGPGLFFACVKPATDPCPVGEVDCDGGNNLGLDLDGESDILDNNPGNAAPCTVASCTTACNTQCGGAANVFDAQCAGFCSKGAEGACTSDMDCLPNDGACNGPDGLPRGNTCECTCINDAVGPAAAAGGLQCQLAFNLTVEMPAGTACDGVGVQIALGDTCAPLTTEDVTAIIVNPNDNGDTLPPASADFTGSGTSIPCATLAASTTTGLTMTGAALFYGSTVGDIVSGLTLNCQ